MSDNVSHSYPCVNGMNVSEPSEMNVSGMNVSARSIIMSDSIFQPYRVPDNVSDSYPRVNETNVSVSSGMNVSGMKVTMSEPLSQCNSVSDRRCRDNAPNNYSTTSSKSFTQSEKSGESRANTHDKANNAASGLKLAHLNVRSLKSRKNHTIDQVAILVESENIDIFCISETWLSPEVADSEITVDGYALYRKDRGSRGGGVAMYVKSDIPHSFRSDLTHNSNIEAVWVTLKPVKRKPFNVCSFYRPPSAGDDYFDNMLQNFETALSEDEAVILGDFNMNYTVDESLASNSAHYLEMFLDCAQLIDKPTRVTNSSSTTIDLIYTSMVEHHSTSGVLECALSDHYMTFTVLKFSCKKRSAPRIVTVRDFKNFDPLQFNNDIMDCGLYDSVSNSPNVDEAWHSWSSNVLTIMNKHAPMKAHRVKNRSNPWMSRDILNLMYKRDHLFKKARQTGDPDLLKEAKRTRNKVLQEIRLAKKSYYTDALRNSSSSKCTWKTIRSLLKSKQSGDIPPIAPDVFNEYFSGIGPSLNSTFPDANTTNWTLPESRYTFELQEISEDDVLKHLSALPDESNIDILGFDAKLLRLGASVLTPSLTALFNMSVECHHLPADWKRARVTPIYKGVGADDEPGNYRPISIVSHVSKILEKLVNCQLISYFDEHCLLTCDQSAFRRGHSTATAAHKLFDDMQDNINEGLVNGICFFDLKKCFDTIDHEILLYKLEKYGIRGNELSWFGSYLSDRSQTVSVNGVSSSFKTVYTGVPQGSVLGPMLFLIFINDLPVCLNGTASNIYADDTAVHASGSTIHEVNTLLQRNIDNIARWFRENKLVINYAKTFCMLTTSNRNYIPTVGLNPEQRLHVNIGHDEIEQVDSIRYLGLYPDTIFSWTKHVMNLCKKISPKVGLLKRLRYIVPIDCLKLIYQTTVQSHIDYCLTVWGFTSGVNIDKVQRLQNRAARIITSNYDFNIRGLELVKELGWLNIRQRRDYFAGILVYKSLNGLSPDHMSDMFTHLRDISDYQTRSAVSSNLYVPRVNKAIFSQSLQVNGPKVWNSLPSHIQMSSSLDSFKCNLKRHLLQ